MTQSTASYGQVSGNTMAVSGWITAKHRGVCRKMLKTTKDLCTLYVIEITR